jgi:hypothetical protein
MLKNEVIEFIDVNIFWGEERAFEGKEGVTKDIGRKEEESCVVEIINAVNHLEGGLGVMIVVSYVIDEVCILCIRFCAMRIS